MGGIREGKIRENGEVRRNGGIGKGRVEKREGREADMKRRGER